MVELCKQNMDLSNQTPSAITSSNLFIVVNKEFPVGIFNHFEMEVNLRYSLVVIIVGILLLTFLFPSKTTLPPESFDRSYNYDSVPNSLVLNAIKVFGEYQVKHLSNL